MEKTIKHELYKHGSYLLSLKESGSSFVNIDDEIKKNEELFQLASKKDHQPAFAVGEYYVTRGLTFKVIAGNRKDRVQTLFLINGVLVKSSRSLMDGTLKNSTPATAEQIATFKRAEHFASKGRKLDEFKGWDTVAFNGVGKTVIGTNDDCVVLCDTAIKKNNPELILIQTAEELQEVEHGEKV